MLTAVVVVVIFVLILAFVLAVAREQGPPPSDVALAYELAWDHLDFESLWAVSGDELRDGLGRREFVAAKVAAYAQQARLSHLAREIVIENVDQRGDLAVVRTRVELFDGDVAHNELHLVRRVGRWTVVEYRLRSDAPPSKP
jgi:hypothetical protein